MRIRMYQATDGDCLLVESSGPARSTMLVDGGRKTSFREHTAPDLSGRDLDLVVVSHIDNDHISGIVGMFDEVVDWRVYRIHEDRLEADRAGLDADELEKREKSLRKLRPKTPEPPNVAAVWHNAFKDLVNGTTGTANAGGGDFAQGQPFRSEFAQSQIDEVLVTAMRMQLLDPRFEEDLEDTANIAQGVKEAVILRNRLSDDQLGIPVNAPAGEDALLYLGDETGDGSVETGALAVGDFSIRILGPSRTDLVRLQELWRKWVRDNEAVARVLRAEAQVESERLDAGQPVVFGSVLANLADRLGDGSTITPPNLASLLMLVEQDQQTLLLTGDGTASEILRGLRLHGEEFLPEDDDDASFHVDVLKIPHHGASDNIDADGFFSFVTADHYLFCGNGSHHNPEKDVVQQILDVRGALVPRLGEYHLWFSSSEAAANTSNRKKHMKMIQALVENAEGCHSHFLDLWEEGEDREGRSYVTIDL